MTTRKEEGQVAPLVVGLALVFFAVAGLAVDGTRAFLHRRTLQNAADAAALAGAGEVDPAAYYSSGGSDVVLQPGRAARIAEAWLRRRGLRVTAGVTASPSMVSVTLRGRIPTLFLRLVGLRDLGVAAQSVAEPGVGAEPP